MHYVAYDFETANHNRSSACSLGAVKIRDGKIDGEFYTLINPEEMFTVGNINVHGILPADVQNAPLYPEVIRHFQAFVGSAPIVSHTNFDVGVICDANRRYQVRDMAFNYFDSYYLAKSIWSKQFNRFGLGPLATTFGYQFNHHHALEDAKACAFLVYKMCQTTGKTDMLELINCGGYRRFGTISDCDKTSFTKGR